MRGPPPLGSPGAGTRPPEAGGARAEPRPRHRGRLSRVIAADATDVEVLREVGVPDLRRVGQHHVVLPEHESGERVAHLVSGRLLDRVEMAQDQPRFAHAASDTVLSYGDEIIVAGHPDDVEGFGDSA